MSTRAIRLLHLILWVFVFSGLSPVQHVAGAVQQDGCDLNGEMPTPPAQGAASKPPDWVITLPWEPGKTHKITSGGGYGFRKHQGTNAHDKPNDHYALDFKLSLTEPVRPIAAGIVKYAGKATGGWSGYGTIVFIDHGNIDGHTYQSLYAHLVPDSIEVSAGDPVTPHTKLGGAGQSGTDSVHLHFALYRDASFQESPDKTGPFGGQSVVPEPFTGIQDYICILPDQYMTAHAVGNLGGFVRSASGAPVREAEVQFVGESVTRRAKTNDDGRYQFTGVPEGVATITARREGFGEKSVEVNVIAGKDTEADDIVFNTPTWPLPIPRPVPTPSPRPGPIPPPLGICGLFFPPSVQPPLAEAGRWEGTTSQGWAFTFGVTADGEIANLLITISTTGGLPCAPGYELSRVVVQDNILITDDQFTYSDEGVNVSGQFTSPTEASGVFDFNVVAVIRDSDGSTGVCTAPIIRNGTWKATGP